MRFKITTVFLIILLSAIVLFHGCIDQIEISHIPEIEFKDYQIKKDLSGRDTALILVIGFQDGDGDIGLAQSDTLPPYHKEGKYYFNLIVRYFEFIDTSYKEVTPSPFSDDTIRYQYRLPIDIYPKTNNKAIKGDIQLSINDILAAHNPVKFKIILYDRQLNKSNEIESPPITYLP